MSNSRDLSSFGGGSKESILPLAHRRSVVWSPTAPDKPAGFICWDRRREVRVYTTRRKDYHYYRSGNGYAVSESVLDVLDRADVPRIIIHTVDGESVYEFASRQYRTDGEPVPESDLLDEDDPQVYVPLSESMNEWGREENPNALFVEGFSVAMDRLSDKSGW